MSEAKKNNAAEAIERATDNRLIILAPQDNVAVVREAIPAGEKLMVSGREVVIAARIGAGHKIARYPMEPGDRILKYGAPIGSATCAIRIGDHVHLHNIKSDYTQAQSLDEARIDHAQSSKGGSDDL